MTLEPVLTAPLAIQIHVFTVVPAAVLGAWVLYGRKGTPLHRLLGRVWVFLMAVTALSSFFIHTIRMIGPFSPIHLLSVLTLFSCGYIIWSARTRRLKAHRQAVLALYWGGIGLAGAFTIVPGRIMNQVVLGGANAWPLAIAAAVVCAGVLAHVYRGGRFNWTARRKTAGTALAVAVSPILLLASNPDAHAAPGAGQIVTGAPVWVWPLLAALLALGWLRSRPRVVHRVQVMILPFVFAGLGAWSFFSNGASLAAGAALVAAIAAGSMAGQMLARRGPSFVDENDMVHLPGEWVSMALILAIFVARFAAGAARGINPDLDHALVIAVPLALVSGFSIGLTAMRAIVQSTR